MSRLTAGRLELNFDRVDLAALAREVAQRFAPDAAAAACAMKIDLPEPLVGLWDEARLDQIATNLIANAVKYGAGGGIEIEGRGTADVVQLIVRDHGIGISAEDQQRIFRRFERASGQRQHPGLGLGLWITSELCKALGGRSRSPARWGRAPRSPSRSRVARRPRSNRKGPACPTSSRRAPDDAALATLRR